MTHLRTLVCAILTLTLVAFPATGRHRAPGRLEASPKKERGLLAKPVEAAPEREGKARNPWGGFYGGLNGGGASGDH